MEFIIRQILHALVVSCLHRLSNILHRLTLDNISHGLCDSSMSRCPATSNINQCLHAIVVACSHQQVDIDISQWQKPSTKSCVFEQAFSANRKQYWQYNIDRGQLHWSMLMQMAKPMLHVESRYRPWNLHITQWSLGLVFQPSLGLNTNARQCRTWGARISYSSAHC